MKPQNNIPSAVMSKPPKLDLSGYYGAGGAGAGTFGADKKAVDAQKFKAQGQAAPYAPKSELSMSNKNGQAGMQTIYNVGPRPTTPNGMWANSGAYQSWVDSEDEIPEGALRAGSPEALSLIHI